MSGFQSEKKDTCKAWSPQRRNGVDHGTPSGPPFLLVSPVPLRELRALSFSVLTGVGGGVGVGRALEHQ